MLQKLGKVESRSERFFLVGTIILLFVAVLGLVSVFSYSQQSLPKWPGVVLLLVFTFGFLGFIFYWLHLKARELGEANTYEYLVNKYLHSEDCQVPYLSHSDRMGLQHKWEEPLYKLSRHLDDVAVTKNRTKLFPRLLQALLREEGFEYRNLVPGKPNLNLGRLVFRHSYGSLPEKRYRPEVDPIKIHVAVVWKGENTIDIYWWVEGIKDPVN